MTSANLWVILTKKSELGEPLITRVCPPSGDIKVRIEPPRSLHHSALHKMSPPLYEFPKDPSPQLEVLQKYYAFLSVFDIDNLNTLFTDDFAQKTLPSSLGVSDKPKNDFFAFLRRLQADFKGQNLNVRIAQIFYSYKSTMICSTVHHIRHQRWSREDLGPCTTFYFLGIDKTDTNSSTFI